MIAEVIIDIKHKNVNQVFSYNVPHKMENFLKKGMRVLVPFGAQTRMGFVTKVLSSSDKATKEIVSVLDVTPTINEESFQLVESIMMSAPNLYSSIFSTVCPNELMMSYQKEISILIPEKIPNEIREFFDKKNKWILSKKDQIYWSKLKSLARENIVSIETIIKEKGVIKTQISYTYNPNHNYERIYRYDNVLGLFLKKQKISKTELLTKGISVSSIKTLEKYRVIIPLIESVTREIKHSFVLKDKKVVLTAEQEQVTKKIVESLGKHSVFLLKGITGSGKTEVYLEVIERVIKNNKQVLILVPEITLIAPMAKRLKSRFQNVLIYHSALSKGEKYDQYRLIHSNRSAILLGTRSSVFLPLTNLGLIIIDEEHDLSYEQRQSVIYDALEIAKLRAKYHDIPLVLGSATPSVVSMYNATKGQYQLLEITKRPNRIKMPTIHLVDMKEELLSGNASIFSKKLLDAMKLRLKRKEQTILLFNRKGYANFVLCKSCSNVPTCPNCEISLTYYKDKSVLRCHYCGHEKTYSKNCGICKKDDLKEVGVGIEFVEHQLKKALPQARVIRMDANVTKTKGSHEIIWNDFLNQQADILLGTQMIAKGLDFPLVTLVGVLMSDLSLKVPSYRASEQTFMLLSQVTGRSGRFLPGEAIIQGYDLEHYAVRSVLESYESFYKEALYYRKIADYMPYKNVSQILIEGISFLKTYQQAYLLRKKIDTKDITVLGPTQALIKKVKERHRFVLTLKFEDIDTVALFKTIKEFSNKDIRVRYFPILDIV